MNIDRGDLRTHAAAVCGSGTAQLPQKRSGWHFAHLREDRRHIRDADIERLAREIDLPLNMEMAATEEMHDIALNILNACCLVRKPRRSDHRRRLNVWARPVYRQIIAAQSSGNSHFAFYRSGPEQIGASFALGADIVELHTGTYCHAHADGDGRIK